MSLEQAILTLAAAIEKAADVMAGEDAGDGTAVGGALPPNQAAAEPAKPRGRGRPKAAAEPPAAPPAPGGMFASPGPQAAGLGGLPVAPAAAPVAGATYAQVQQALMELDQKKGREVCVNLLARYGAQKLPEVNPTQFGQMLAEINATLTSGHDPAAAQAGGGMFG